MAKKQSKAARPKRVSAKKPPTRVRANAMVSSGAVEHSGTDVMIRQREVAAKLAEKERQRRVEAYDQAIREATEMTASAAFFGRAKAKKVAVPIRILAEGDSWFDFPFGGRPFEKGDTIAQLAHLIPYPILNQANRGDEVRQMLGVAQRQRLENFLDDNDRDFNVLLFSGGGNDLVGDPFCLWLRTRAAAGGDPALGIDEPAFANALGIVKSAYEQLVDLRDAIVAKRPSRRIVMFLNGYDFAVPTGKGVCGYGPWLQPSLTYRGWTNRTEATAIVRMILSRFAAVLNDLATRRKDVILVPTQGTLGSEEWNDELHPNGKGFKKIAEKFVLTLRRQFPDNFP